MNPRGFYENGLIVNGGWGELTCFSQASIRAFFGRESGNSPGGLFRGVMTPAHANDERKKAQAAIELGVMEHEKSHQIFCTPVGFLNVLYGLNWGRPFALVGGPEQSRRFSVYAPCFKASLIW